MLHYYIIRSALATYQLHTILRLERQTDSVCMCMHACMCACMCARVCEKEHIPLRYLGFSYHTAAGVRNIKDSCFDLFCNQIINK